MARYARYGPSDRYHSRSGSYVSLQSFDSFLSGCTTDSRPATPPAHSPPTFSSLFYFALSLFISTPIKRRLLLLFTFLVCLSFTVIMKWEKLVWIAASTVGAWPTAERGQSRQFKYEGLKFGSDGKFLITVFEDFHLGESPDKHGHALDDKTISVMEKILVAEPADLVVLNGDLVNCDSYPADPNSLIDRIITPLINREIPFAATFGNHDNDRACDTRAMSQHMWDKARSLSKKKLAFTTSSVPGDLSKIGTSNYFIPVYAHGSDNLEMILWFFDSRGGRSHDTGQDEGNFVDEEVVKWYIDTRDRINKEHNRDIPSLIFVHIPVHAAIAFQDQRNMKAAPGINADKIFFESMDNDNQWLKADIPLMNAMTSDKGLIATFSGHLHGIDWCANWAELKGNEPGPGNGNGIKICFGRRTGYTGYGAHMRGARRIVVEQTRLAKHELETWVRLEDGSVSGQVTLNSTFGSDLYPEVSRKYSKLEDDFGWNPTPAGRPAGPVSVMSLKKHMPPSSTFVP